MDNQYQQVHTILQFWCSSWLLKAYLLLVQWHCMIAVMLCVNVSGEDMCQMLQQHSTTASGQKAKPATSTRTVRLDNTKHTTKDA